MSWHLGRLASFDTETTGVSVETDRIVTACVALLGGGQPQQIHRWIADPGVEIPEDAAKIHGYSTERARKEGRPPAEVVEQVVALLAEQVQTGVPLVAMNAPFDLTLLDREARRHGVTPLTELVPMERLFVIDPKVLDKHVSFRKGRRTLTHLCEHYQVGIDGAHDSAADAVAAARVAWRIGSQYQKLADRTLAELHEAQVGWAAEQAASLQEYFSRQPGKQNEVVDGAWPLRPFPPAVADSGVALPP
jgi:DNA polymerase III epsilon subunit-like protein